MALSLNEIEAKSHGVFSNFKTLH